MRKIYVIAAREYHAAVRTKTFVVSLVMLPVLMGGSILAQALMRGIVDTADKHFVLINHDAPPNLVASIKSKADDYNRKQVFEDGRQTKPRLVIERVEPAAAAPEERKEQRFKLSEEVRAGRLDGFLEIIPAAKKADKTDKPAAQIELRYQSNRLMSNDFAEFVKRVVTEELRGELARKSRLSPEQAAALLHPVDFRSEGLMRRDAGGQIQESSQESRFVPLAVAVLLMLLMFMVVMMTATPFMQSVVEEKMQRVAEVLLGSVPPFELMMGKLLGMVAVSLTIAGFYLAGAYWAALHFHVAGDIPLSLLAWFVVFQMLAGLMYGSLFLAIGAACTDMKETQNLMLPVMLLVCFPLFLMGSLLREPHSGVARGLSLFPFATPTLMIARLASPPGPDWWEPIAGLVLVLITTLLSVYAAGRIFRVGILLQGKGARFGDILRWVLRG